VSELEYEEIPEEELAGAEAQALPGFNLTLHVSPPRQRAGGSVKLHGRHTFAGFGAPAVVQLTVRGPESFTVRVATSPFGDYSVTRRFTRPGRYYAEASTVPPTAKSARVWFYITW
jgi:hypothetical protein